MESKFIQIPAETMIQPVPAFQPVLSAMDRCIYGYEVLDRFFSEGQIKSMGPHFMNPEINSAKKLEWSQSIRLAAFKHYSLKGYQGKLFINIKPSWAMDYKNREESIPTLLLAREYGIPMENIVIEITEDQFSGRLKDLTQVINAYRKQGCMIALDDFDLHNFDRMLQLRPDIIKLDIRLVKQMAQSQEYQALLKHLSNLAMEFGITVLCEGIETEEDLENSIMAGACFLQGFVFSPAEIDFQADNRYSGIIDQSLMSVIRLKRNQYKVLMEIDSRLHRLLSTYIQQGSFIQKTENGKLSIDYSLEELLPKLPADCFRAFICDSYGNQVSSNYKRDSENFLKQPQYKKQNWTWRPYFLANMMKIRSTGGGIISSKYLDPESKKETVTYSFPLNRRLILFLDLRLDGTLPVY